MLDSASDGHLRQFGEVMEDHRQEKPRRLLNLDDHIEMTDQEIARTRSELNAAFARFGNSHRQLVQNLASALTTIVPTVATALSTNLRRVSDQISQSINAIQDHLSKSQLILARNGWFPDPEMPISISIQLARDVCEYSADVDATVGTWMRDRLDKIEEELLNSHPHRAELISQAFWAHRSGKFGLSVPVVLSQADGIWHDRFSRAVFVKAGRDIAFKEFTEKGVNVPYYLYLLSFPLPLWLPEHERPDPFNELNRHLVLHGVTTAYASEEYSLKAISFLRWIHWITSEDDSVGIDSFDN